MFLGSIIPNLKHQIPNCYSPWHSLTPRTRLLCALLMVFAITLTPNNRWLGWLIYALGIGVLILISRVSLVVLIQRIAVEFAFVGAVLLGTLFRGGGDIIWSWGLVQITAEGLTILGSVAIKALLSLLMLNLLTLTTSIPALLNALVALKTPPLLVAILASMYRYINLSISEFNDIKRAAISRNLTAKGSWRRQIIANIIGSLFIRAYERGDRVHQAMLARGYRGTPLIADLPKDGKLDIIAIASTGILILAGQLA